MLQTNQPISIGVACDNHYIMLLAALIKSIEANIREGQKVNLYIIEDNVSNRNRNKLQQSINPEITTLIWKPIRSIIRTIIASKMRLPVDNSSYPMNIYFRFFIPFFVPDDVEKVLYLDVDMIVQKDITELFEVDLNNYVVGAVLDPRILTFDNSWGGILNYKALGLPGDTKYFNTGLLLMNIPKWKEFNVTEKIMKCIYDNRKFANYPDQYALNIVLANRWLELNALWNHFCVFEHPSPYIIHFVQRKPIYQSYNNSLIYKEIFFSYLNKTKWKNFKLIGEMNRYIKKIRNIIDKLFK